MNNIWYSWCLIGLIMAQQLWECVSQTPSVGRVPTAPLWNLLECLCWGHIFPRLLPVSDWVLKGYKADLVWDTCHWLLPKDSLLALLNLPYTVRQYKSSSHRLLSLSFTQCLIGLRVCWLSLSFLAYFLECSVFPCDCFFEDRDEQRWFRTMWILP